MDRKGLLAGQVFCLLTAFANAGGAAADEEEVEGEDFDRTPVDCISTNRIKQTKVIDDQTVLFEMNGGAYLSNLLDRKCPGLGREKRFMHQTTSGRLCDIDTITVLEQWGSTLNAGFTCALGGFYPITEIEAQELVLGPDVAGAQEPDVEVTEVELPPEQPATEADEVDEADEAQ